MSENKDNVPLSWLNAMKSGTKEEMNKNDCEKTLTKKKSKLEMKLKDCVQSFSTLKVYW